MLQPALHSSDIETTPLCLSRADACPAFISIHLFSFLWYFLQSWRLDGVSFVAWLSLKVAIALLSAGIRKLLWLLLGLMSFGVILLDWRVVQLPCSETQSNSIRETPQLVSPLCDASVGPPGLFECVTDSQCLWRAHTDSLWNNALY